MNKTSFKIFKAGSTTYFYSSIFFPEPLRSDVFTLYSFVRKADDYVDMVPQDKNGFTAFCDAYQNALNGIPSGDPVIDNFISLKDSCGLPDEWVNAFLKSMAMDLEKNTYKTLDETLEYIYGSAEVIGLFMARLMNLDESSYEAARYLGRAMQYINFIRDIDEDNGLGRTYLPLETSGLSDLQRETAASHKEAFNSFIQKQIELYKEWQKKAETGYKYIPRRYLIPIKTAADMYMWTSQMIAKNPMVVYEKKMKPGASKIIKTVLKNALTLPWRKK